MAAKREVRELAGRIVARLMYGRVLYSRLPGNGKNKRQAIKLLKEMLLVKVLRRYQRLYVQMDLQE